MKLFFENKLFGKTLKLLISYNYSRNKNKESRFSPKNQLPQRNEKISIYLVLAIDIIKKKKRKKKCGLIFLVACFFRRQIFQIEFRFLEIFVERKNEMKI